jgi:mono/diheme cytochrome c family protein
LTIAAGEAHTYYDIPAAALTVPPRGRQFSLVRRPSIIGVLKTMIVLSPAMKLALLLVPVAALALVACHREPAPKPTATTGAAAPANAPSATEAGSSMDLMTKGERLFQDQCAQCHGPEAQGHPDWQNPQVTAAPPLDGSGNDWKRSKASMIDIIENGEKRGSEPVHPAFKGRLSREDIDAIISWYQALWPPEVYARWQKANPAPTPKG